MDTSPTFSIGYPRVIPSGQGWEDIPSEDIEELQVEVSKYEPRLALDGGEDGLDYYKRIINKAPIFLKKNGLLAFEIGYNQGEEIKQLLECGKFENIRVIKDLGGRDRVVLAVQQLKI